MSSIRDQHLAVPLIDDTSTVVESDSLRYELIYKITYLLEHVDPADKNILIKQAIRKSAQQKFDLAKSWSAEDQYYKTLLHALDFAQLQQVMQILKAAFASGVPIKPSTHTALAYVFSGVTPSSAASVINAAYETLGKHMAQALDNADQKLCVAENQVNPSRDLEARELKAAGNPCSFIFKKYLLSISGDDRARFNERIRKVINDSSISTIEQQRRLLFAASRLADLLQNQGQGQKAHEITALLQKAGYRPKPKPERGNLLDVIMQVQRQALTSIFPLFAKRHSRQKAYVQPEIPESSSALQQKNDAIEAKRRINEFVERMQEVLQQQKNYQTSQAELIQANAKHPLLFRNAVPEVTAPAVLTPKLAQTKLKPQ